MQAFRLRRTLCFPAQQFVVGRVVNGVLGDFLIAILDYAFCVDNLMIERHRRERKRVWRLQVKCET